MSSILREDDNRCISKSLSRHQNFQQQQQQLLKNKKNMKEHLSSARSEESRSFLNFSCENLSISNSELEQGFNGSNSKSSRFFRFKRNNFVSFLALFLALGCSLLELWKLRCVISNSQEIELIKREIETLKHRFLEKDLLEELKAFEEQLYGNEEEDVESNGDYDSSYDDAAHPESHDYSGDYQTVTSSLKSTSSSSSTPTTRPQHYQQLHPTKDLKDVLAVLKKVEIERTKELEESLRRDSLLQNFTLARNNLTIHTGQFNETSLNVKLNKTKRS